MISSKFKGGQDPNTNTTPITTGRSLKSSSNATTNYNHKPLTQVEVAELIAQCKAYVQSKKQS